MRLTICCLAFGLLVSPVRAELASDASLVEPLRAPASGVADASEFDAALDAASAPVNTPARREARDFVFRGLVPLVETWGAPATTSEVASMMSALGSFPCSGGSRTGTAHVLGDVARLSVAGRTGGGCSVLVRRDGATWRLVMALGWTLATAPATPRRSAPMVADLDN